MKRLFYFKVSIFALGAVFASLFCPCLLYAASFQGLGDLPGGGFNSLAYAVSADGSVVVGNGYSELGREPFRWENGIMTGLGHLPGGNSSTAKAVSADGSVVVGVTQPFSGGDPPEGWRWENDVMTSLGDLPGGDSFSWAHDISADGVVVVGDSGSALGSEAYRWENGVMTGLGDLPGGEFWSAALGVSADGSVIVGMGWSDLGFEAFRWEDGEMVGLGDLPGGSFSSSAIDVSVDGSVVVGYGSGPDGKETFRWEDGVMVGLGSLLDGEGNILESRPCRVSADGSVVVGTSFKGVGPGMEPEFRYAFIWTEEDGMLYLQGLLEEDYGLDLTGWTLEWATGISNDGMTIVGSGVNPDDNREAWIAVLSEPAIEAEIDVNPNTLNLSGKGRWITCYIWLPAEYDVAEIDPNSVVLGEDIDAAHVLIDEQEELVTVKFSRSQLREYLQSIEIEGNEVELTVSGELVNGTGFEGIDTIRLVDKSGKKK